MLRGMPPRIITVKDVMARYGCSERTAIRWRRVWVERGHLATASVGGRTLIGDWATLDRVVASGALYVPESCSSRRTMA